MLGCQLVSFVLIWHLTQLTGSAIVLSTAALVSLLPQILLGPFAGVLIDRLSRKGILVATQILVLVALIGLFVLFSSSDVKIASIYVAIFLLGIVNAINYPAVTVVTTLMVPERHLTRIQGMNQTFQGGLNILSAPLGAFLLQALPLQLIFLLSCLAPAVAIVSLVLVGIPCRVNSSQAAVTVFTQLQEGLRCVLAWPGLRLIVGIAILLNFLDYPAIALTPLLVSKHFHGDALQLGWLNSTFSAGIIVGGLVLSGWGGFRRGMATAMAGLVGLGLGALVVGLAPAALFGIAVGGIFIKGFMQTVTNGPIIAALQSTVDVAMQGRVISLVGALTTLAAPLGLMVAGPLTEKIGVPAWYVLLGAAGLAVGSTAFGIRAIMDFDHKIYSET
jgi:DHA3 family macrolide efflux protein-like MFS transporter